MSERAESPMDFVVGEDEMQTCIFIKNPTKKWNNNKLFFFAIFQTEKNPQLVTISGLVKKLFSVTGSKSQNSFRRNLSYFQIVGGFGISTARASSSYVFDCRFDPERP